MVDAEFFIVPDVQEIVLQRPPSPFNKAMGRWRCVSFTSNPKTHMINGVSYTLSIVYSLWMFMDVYGCLWIFMVVLWMFMDVYECL